MSSLQCPHVPCRNRLLPQDPGAGRGRPYPAQLLSQQQSLRFNCSLCGAKPEQPICEVGTSLQAESSLLTLVPEPQEKPLCVVLCQPWKGALGKHGPHLSPSHGVGLRLCGGALQPQCRAVGSVQACRVPEKLSVLHEADEARSSWSHPLPDIPLPTPVFLCVGFYSFTYLGSSTEKTTKCKCSIYPLW